MPNVIRTETKSTLISEYHKHYKENQFEPLSNSTLFRILDARAASQRKSLSGLDNIATDGATAFDLVEKIVDEVEKVTMASQWAPTARRNLREGKNYLKTDYRLHCKETESPCPDHCRRFALSNPNDKFFRSGVHIDILLFVIVVKTLSDVENTLKTCEGFHSMEQNRDDLMHDFLQAKDAIFAWKAHILRSENQEKAKQVALKDLNEKSVLIVMDWAMKFVQLRYREKQSDWFGKRGLNWHISSVISKKSDGQYEITSYAHLSTVASKTGTLLHLSWKIFLVLFQKRIPKSCKPSLDQTKQGVTTTTYCWLQSTMSVKEAKLKFQLTTFQSHSMEKMCVIASFVH